MCDCLANMFIKVSTDQWRSVPFKMREEYLYFYYNILDDSHIPFTKFNVTAIGLGYWYSNFPIPIMRLLQPSLWMKVYKVSANKSRAKFELTDTDTWTYIQYRIANSCLHLADIGCNTPLTRCKHVVFLLASMCSPLTSPICFWTSMHNTSAQLCDYAKNLSKPNRYTHRCHHIS
jgi:hypothetical protein